MAQALMLSETAEFDSKPELEIFADDVVCGHGSTSGQLDDDLLFYLPVARHPGERGPRAADRVLCRRGDREKSSTRSLRDALLAAYAPNWLGVGARRTDGKRPMTAVTRAQDSQAG